MKALAILSRTNTPWTRVVNGVALVVKGGVSGEEIEVIFKDSTSINLSLPAPKVPFEEPYTGYIRVLRKKGTSPLTICCESNHGNVREQSSRF